MKDLPMLREMVRRVMVRETAGQATSDELAAAVTQVFTKLLVHLSSVLGETGSLALFRRSLRLAEGGIPFREIPDTGPGTLLPAIGAWLRGQPPEAVRQASEAVLAAFVELLANFIGERLTSQLLQEAWPDLPASSSQESEE